MNQDSPWRPLGHPHAAEIGFAKVSPFHGADNSRRVEAPQRRAIRSRKNLLRSFEDHAHPFILARLVDQIQPPASPQAFHSIAFVSKYA